MRSRPNRKRAVLLAFILVAAVLSGGCGFGTVEDMLSPPKLTDEQSAIYKALTDSKGSGFKLKYPRSGEYRSAFTVYGDVEDAAIVFYEISGINIERSLWMNFLFKNEDGAWESTYELPIKGTDIERISFPILGDDTEPLILLNYTVSTVSQNEKAFMIISGVEEKSVSKFEDFYSFMRVDNFFGKEKRELLIIKNDRGVESSTATFYTRRSGRLVSSASCELDPGAGEYTNITQGYSAKGVPALFINHKKFENSENYGTDILYYHGGRLINPAMIDPANTEKLLRKTGSSSELANPRDINGDGIIEVCSSAGEFPGYQNLPASEKPRPVIWRTAINYTFSEILYYSYYTEKFDFVFFLPSRWINEVTPDIAAEENTVVFQKAADMETPLLSIRTVFGEDEPPDSPDWTLFESGKENGARYYIKTENPGDPLTLTAEELQYAFTILSEITE